MDKIEDLKEIKLFVDACDGMLESKFILVDKRIGDVLKSIAQTKKVYNLMATCLVGFNFDREWKLATSKSKELSLPLEERKCIAFVFCLLNAVDDNKLNINEILQKYFSGDDCTSAYKLFCQRVILPFKVHVVGQLYEKQEKKIVIVEDVEANNKINKDILKRLVFLIKDLKSYVSGMKKIKGSYLTKDELLFIMNHYIEQCEKERVEGLPVFTLSIRAGMAKDKELIRRLYEIDQIVKEIK